MKFFLALIVSFIGFNALADDIATTSEDLLKKASNWINSECKFNQKQLKKGKTIEEFSTSIRRLFWGEKIQEFK